MTSGTVRAKTAAAETVQIAFRQDAAGRVLGAEKQHVVRALAHGALLATLRAVLATHDVDCLGPRRTACSRSLVLACLRFSPINLGFPQGVVGFPRDAL